jgi:[ribosomal protein S5]-alanine N-acetyltransferase
VTDSVPKFIEGVHLYLREVRLTDVNEKYYSWMSNPLVTRYLESRFRPLSLEALQRYVQEQSSNSAVLFLAIVTRDTHTHIGNIKLGPIDWIHRTGDIGLMIGDTASWGKGFATEAIRLLTEYAFRCLNLQKVTASCYSNNPGSAQAFRKAGFETEGTRRRQFYSDGEYVDQVLFGHVRPRVY